MHEIQRRVKQLEVSLVGAGSRYFREDRFFPFGFCIINDGFKGGLGGDFVFDMLTSLLLGNPGDADSRDHFSVLKSENSSDSLGGA